jgi:hypothetical protein
VVSNDKKIECTTVKVVCGVGYILGLSFGNWKPRPGLETVVIEDHILAVISSVGQSLFEGTLRLMGVENGKIYERHVFCNPHKIRRIYFPSLDNAVGMEVGGLLSRIEVRYELAGLHEIKLDTLSEKKLV